MLMGLRTLVPVRLVLRSVQLATHGTFAAIMIVR